METQLLITDQFYNDVDAVREFALQQDFSVKGNYPGNRTISFLNDSINVKLVALKLIVISKKSADFPYLELFHREINIVFNKEPLEPINNSITVIANIFCFYFCYSSEL